MSHDQEVKESNTNETPAVVEEVTRQGKAEFHFRTDAKKDSPTFGTKRDSVKLVIPLLTAMGLIEALNTDEKVSGYILDLVNDQLYIEAKVQVDASLDITQETLDLKPLSVQALAAKPKSESRGGGIPKEVWADFVKDYVQVMVEATGKDVQKVTAAAGIFNRRLVDVKSNKAMLVPLQEFLALWYTTTKKAETFAAIFEVLNSKIESFLADDGKSAIESIM